MGRRLSVFVDESGDFGNLQPHSTYYLVTMLFHNQDDNITADNAILNANASAIGFDPRSLHTGPIIRREGYYLSAFSSKTTWSISMPLAKLSFTTTMGRSS